ncbi:MAG: FtsX-like permease family protein [Acidimicrobiales bacterium]|nr:FtsX-like permease family protein [Acidimicrobiales bacterium]MCB9392497.1 FtsX-like permease family protein [Acidimicrobiaceae bacterium]
MFRLAFKSALARKGRLVLTSLAVIAGCAFLSGVFVFSDTIQGSFDKLFADAYEDTDAFVRSSNVIEGDFGQESRDRLPDSVIADVAAVPGVRAAFGDVQGFASIATADGDTIGQDGPPRFGSVWIGASESPWDLAEGAGPTGPGEVVVDRQTAKNGSLEVGDTVRITSQGGSRAFTVSGIATFAGNDSSNGASWALFDLPTAQEFVIAQPDLVDAVIVVGDGSATDDDLAAAIRQQFDGQEVEVLTGAEITEENQSAVEEGLQFFTIFLTIFAVISLFVGSFIIYNVFSISAAQRQRENALLRAVGASRGQVTRVLFVEALLIGVIGGLLGFAGGVALAFGIMQLLSAIGFGPSDTALTVQPWVLVVSVIVGAFVTLVCAIVPAVRAGRVPPLAAMRDVAVDRTSVSRVRLVGGAVILVLAITATVLGITGSAVWLGPGVAGLFASLVVLGPLLAAPVSRVVTRPLTAIRGVTGEIAGRNAATNPKRTALTAGALAIGLALLIGVSTLGSSVKTSIRESIGEQFTGDFAVSTSDSQGFGGLPVSMTDELNELPEVEVAVGIGVNIVQLIEDGEPAGKTVLTVDAARAATLFELPFTEGGWSSLDADGILMSKDKADRDGLGIGDPVTAVFTSGERRDLTLVGIFDSEDFGNLIVDRQLFADQAADQFDVQVLVQSASGVSTADATAAIESVTGQYPTAKVQTRDAFIDDQASQVDGFLNFIYALLGMSVFIAVLGIVITLLLAIYERRRELGLVRAIGMTRPQVRSSIRWEAAITAVLGALMGTVLGVALGYIVVKALEDQGLNSFSISVVSIVVFVVASILVAIAAAWIPARRAANADILQAIATT